MIKFYLLSCIIFLSSTGYTQNVGIGTTTPNASAILEIKAGDKGLLIPRTSTASRTAIVNPAKGLMVYDTTTSSFWFYNSSAWVQIVAGGSGWSLTGNVGTNPANNFIGTSDVAPIIFKINNERAGIIDTTTSNSAIGFRSLDSITIGTHNAAFGYKALTSNKDGLQNTAIGSNALRKNTSGLYNTAAGMQALTSNINGTSNTGVGNASLFANSSGSNNTAIGTGALFSNSVGDNNTGVGYQSLNINSTGYSNVGVGVKALHLNTIRNNLVAVGDSALYNNGTGAVSAYQASQNTAIGSKVLFSNTTGYNNTGLGLGTLFSNTTGYNNTAIGRRALESNTVGHDNVAVGDGTLGNNEGNYNTGIGIAALAEGNQGYYNTATGAYALFTNTDGTYNTANGSNALYFNSVGSVNTAFGSDALYTNSTGSNNTATGAGSLYVNTGSYNTASGAFALIRSTVGNNNTAHGYRSLEYLTTGSNNTAIGYGAGVYTLGGDLSNSTAIGYVAVSTASNKVRIGNTTVTVIEGQVNWSYPSDGRFKTNISETVKGIDFIMKLRPVVYNFQTKKYDEFLRKDMGDKTLVANQDYTESESIRQTGFVAQEVEKAAKESGFDFNGVIVPKNDKQTYGLSYSQFVVPLVKAVQEQQQQIELLKKENEAQKLINNDLLKRLSKIESQLKNKN